MIDWITALVIVLSDVLVAFLFVIVINPSKASQKVKKAILDDEDYIEDVIAAITAGLFKPIAWKDEKNQIQNIMPIEIVSNYLLTGMKQWINGKQSEMTQELEKGATEALAEMPQNPMQGLMLQQIPKKYRPYVQLLANFLLQQRNP